MDEFALIADIFAPLATAAGAFGLTDDAAIIAPRAGQDLVVTTDTICEGSDFFAFDPPASIARKALRVNLSDLAAKGAVPEFYLLNLSLPATMTSDWLKSFAEGLSADQQHFGISLLGGDTGRTEGPLGIAVTAFGFLPAGTMSRRKGAQAGDAIYVTGTIGDSGGGLAIFRRETHSLSEQDRDALIARYRVPQPPVAFGPTLRGLAHAAIDVSDGLIADIGHLAAASGIAIALDADAIPRSAALRAFWGDGDAALIRAATAGDDYQIAFAADSAQEDAIMAAAAETCVTVSRIGGVTAGEGVTLLRAGAVLPVARPGFRHF